MCFYIGIEDLVANALIEAIEQQGDNKFLTYEKIELYGSKVVEILGEQGEKAVLILSRNDTNNFFKNYSEFFEEKTVNNKAGIILKEGKDVKDLREQFRGYLALDLLIAFCDKRSVQALGI